MLILGQEHNLDRVQSQMAKLANILNKAGAKYHPDFRWHVDSDALSLRLIHNEDIIKGIGNEAFTSIDAALESVKPSAWPPALKFHPGNYCYVKDAKTGINTLSSCVGCKIECTDADYLDQIIANAEKYYTLSLKKYFGCSQGEIMLDKLAAILNKAGEKYAFGAKWTPCADLDAPKNSLVIKIKLDPKKLSSDVLERYKNGIIHGLVMSGILRPEDYSGSLNPRRTGMLYKQERDTLFVYAPYNFVIGAASANAEKYYGKGLQEYFSYGVTREPSYGDPEFNDGFWQSKYESNELQKLAKVLNEPAKKYHPGAEWIVCKNLDGKVVKQNGIKIDLSTSNLAFQDLKECEAGIAYALSMMGIVTGSYLTSSNPRKNGTLYNKDGDTFTVYYSNYPYLVQSAEKYYGKSLEYYLSSSTRKKLVLDSFTKTNGR